MLTNKEYQFFRENAPQGVFKGEGKSLGVIGKHIIADFDIPMEKYIKERETIENLEMQGLIEYTPMEPDPDFNEEHEYVIIDVLPAGFDALKEAEAERTLRNQG